MLLTLGIFAATGLDTEFDERDFLPDGEAVSALIDRLDTQFGGDVGERTFMLIDGRPNDPALVGAAAQLERDLPLVEGVRLIGDEADAISPFFFVEMYGAQGEAARSRIAADISSWLDPEQAAADMELPDPIDESVLDDDGELDLPDDLEDALARRLGAGSTILGSLIATMDPVELERVVRDAIADSFRDERPNQLGDETLAALAALDEHELTITTLDGAGLLPELSSATITRLETLEQMEHVGWTGSRPRDGATWLALLDVVTTAAPDEMAGVRDSEGVLLNVATSGGQNARALAAALDAQAEGVRVAGGHVTVVSEALMQAEIIESLSAAQLQAILISLASAALLLVAASLFTSRSVGLGLIGIVPSVVALVFVLGSMRLIGIPFNALTATVASIAVGIGVPYGIHLINRFREARAHGMTPEQAIADTLRNTGPALVGSAVTTALAFGVLVMSVSTPVVQFGRVSFLMIGYALLACLLVQPALLVLWARRRDLVGRR